MSKSLKRNAFINAIRTIFNVIFPLITFPYASKVLGVTNVGKFTFANSIVSYFILIAGLGIYSYSVREGALYKDDKVKISEFFSEILVINILSMIASYVLLFCLYFSWEKLYAYKVLLLILSFSIALITFGCEWIYVVYEEFIYITLRSVLFQCIAIVYLFLFVKDKNDVIYYAVFFVISSTGSNIINVMLLRKKVYFTFRNIINLKKHIVPILTLFATSIANVIYVNSDMTLLGLFSNDYHVGLYSVSTKVYSIVKGILAAIIIVSIPRMSYYWNKKQNKKFKELGEQIFEFLFIFGFPSIVGLIVLSKEIILIVSSKEYLASVDSLIILSCALVFSIFSWFFQSCILIPSKNETKVLKATLLSALVNIIFNIILIPIYHQNAAAFTTFLAEMLSMILSIVYSLNIWKLSIKIRDIFTVIVGCIGIILYSIFIKGCHLALLSNVILTIVGSLFIYLVAVIVFRKDLIYSLVKKRMN
ncbi:flippase [uncultured Enterococcus sp.]|uniref:flippase n=1 Tax=uncultured Enterococcus sp. TaxID=167972 RepID=UPI00260774F5|nr:flippase [uncultured Enterococcus sp.]